MVTNDNNYKLMNININKQTIKTNDNIDKIINNIVSNTNYINECVLYSEDKIKEEEINQERISNIYKDKTSYEVNCNEIIYDKN